MKQLLLIDANSMIHRAYHALPRTFASKEGKPTNALFGLARILIKIIREKRPDFIAACFDRPEETFRKQEFKEYKAQRPETPDDLVSQIIGARELFAAFGIRSFEEPMFEADDIIATFVGRFENEENVQIVILTGDRDTLQLVCGDKVVVRAPKKGVSETVTYDEKLIIEQYGLAPRQMIDYKALVGDPSDNIKGVSGIGPKTASRLLVKYGTLENIYAAADKDDEIGKKFSGTESVAYAAKKLVTLRKDAPVSAQRIDELDFVDTPKEILEKYFEKMGFASLIKDIRKNVSVIPLSRQGSMW